MYSQNQMRILAILFAHPGEEFYLSEIGGILDKSPGLFQRGINALVNEGVLISRKRGNQRMFTVNEEYPLLSEIRSIVNKTIGVEALLRDFSKSISGIIIALLYGSYTKNMLRPDSDIDLLLVLSEKGIEDEIISRLSKIEQQIRREVNYTAYLKEEFENKLCASDPFLCEILKGKHILLKGEQ